MIVDSNLTSDAIFLNIEDPMVSLPNSGPTFRSESTSHKRCVSTPGDDGSRDDNLVFPYEDNRSIRGTLLLRYVAETINVEDRVCINPSILKPLKSRVHMGSPVLACLSREE